MVCPCSFRPHPPTTNNPNFQWATKAGQKSTRPTNTDFFGDYVNVINAGMNANDTLSLNNVEEQAFL